MPAAKAEDARMKAEFEAERTRRSSHIALASAKVEAAQLLGLSPERTKGLVSGKRVTLRDFLLGRWAEHVMVTQNATTRRTTRSHVGYLTFYLSGLPLDEIDDAAVAKVREGLFRDGPRAFTVNKSGEPRRARAETFTPTSINRILATLAAALNLAEREKLIDRAPRVDLLPRDQSEPIVPPTDAELQAILKAAEQFREIAPLMPEAIELASETGMRAGEQFALTWRSVDFAMGDTGGIRIEKQPRAKLVGGKPWVPKHRKSRIIPLTPRARALLQDLRARAAPSGPSDPVIPSRGGSPYNRLEAAPDKSGKGYFPDVVAAAELAGHVRWHDLRHYFAVRALMRGVPMAVVSSWLGHSDINLTVKRYGRWAAEAREQWQWAKRMNDPMDAVQPRPALGVIDGGRDGRG
jgi:integrase